MEPSEDKAMKTFEAEVNIPKDRRLTIALPEDVEVGDYQVVVVMTRANQASNHGHQLNTLAGQVQSFKDVDAVAWQKQQRDDWDAD